MEAVLASKPSTKREHADADTSASTVVSRKEAAGAPAGTPLYLQRASTEEEELEEVNDLDGVASVQRLLQRQEDGAAGTDDDEQEELLAQMQPEEPEEEIEEPSEEAVASVQPKLAIGKPGDVYEREADEVSNVVMRMPAPSAQRGPLDEEELNPSSLQNGVQRKAIAGQPSVQRACSTCAAEEAEREDEERVQRKETSSPGSSRASPISLEPPDSGSPIPRSVKERVEPVLDADLSHVRIHTSPGANEAAKSIHAKAFTHRNHIWLGPSQSSDDVALISHEATHVVQQGEGGDLERVQRAPSDYRHPEDGAKPASRMRDAIGEKVDELPDVDPDDAGARAEARSKATSIDRGELASERSALEPEAGPDVDRPAAEAPGIESASSQTEMEAEKPTEPITDKEKTGSEGEGAEEEGEAKEKEKEKEKEAASPEETAASVAESAFSMADSIVEPTLEPEVSIPPPADPVDAGGKPLASDIETDLRVESLADEAQVLREKGTLIRQRAAEERGNAEIIRGNVEIVRGGVSQAEQSIETAQGQLEERRGINEQAQQALAVSEEKAAKVASEAPGFKEKSEEGQRETGPMASEARATAAENASQSSDDPEAGAKQREQGNKMNQVGDDSATMDDAVSQTKAKAESLSGDAERAQSLNAETKEKLGEVNETLGKSDKRVGEMRQQAKQARSQVEAQFDQPAAITAQADELDQRGLALVQASYELEQRVQQTQTSYEQGMRAVPAQRAMPEPESSGEELAQLTPEDEDERYENREQINLGEAVPTWISGAPDPLTEQQREEAQAREQERRQGEVDVIDEWAGGRFEELGAADKMGIALGLMGRSVWGKVSKIKWPDWSQAGKLLLTVLDPRASLGGVIGGLSMMLSGGANLLSAEQWKKDPLGNLLKSSADIATGLTVVLGSITALAAAVAAIMTAITIVSLGFAAPVTGPIISFCASVMVTVGGWTIAVGKVALVLQALVLIKNLIDAATAETAEELQSETDQIRSDVGNMANVAMHVVGARGAAKGARRLQSKIGRVGGGVRFGTRMGAEVGTLPTRAIGGAKSLAMAARSAGVRGIARGGVALGRKAVDRVRAIPGRLGAGIRRTGRRVKRRLITAPRRTLRAPRKFLRSLRNAPARVRADVAENFRRDLILGRGPGRRGRIRSLRDAYRVSKGTRGFVRRRVRHDIGVRLGRARARADGLGSSGFRNPFESRGAFGQGFDDIMQGPNNTWYIIEYKGGGATLSSGQMSRAWVRRNIARLRSSGGAEGRRWAQILTTASRQGRLRGRIYSTGVEKGLPGTPIQVGSDLHY